MISVDMVSIPLGVLGLAIGAYRLVHRERFASINLTVLAFALGVGLLVRSPWLGDVVIDGAIGDATGWWNVPDVLGHLATFTAMAAAMGFFVRALGYRTPLWMTYVVLLIVSAVCVVIYAGSPAKGTQTVNMVHMEGMAAYSALFALALMITHAFGSFIARHGYVAAGWRPDIVLLVVATTAGMIMAVHRLLVLAAPALEDYWYGPITWTSTLLCILGYLGAAYFVSRPPRTQTSSDRCPAEQPEATR